MKSAGKTRALKFMIINIIIIVVYRRQNDNVCKSLKFNR